MAPTISISKEGVLSISTTHPTTNIRYTLDGSTPTISSHIYTSQFECRSQTTVSAAVFTSTGKRGEISSKIFDLSKASWSIIGQSSTQNSGINKLFEDYEFYVSIDNNPLTWINVAQGSFPNIRNSPVYRTVPLRKPVKCRYFKFVAKSVLDGQRVTIAELGVRVK